jgi:hypothetical protein
VHSVLSAKIIAVLGTILVATMAASLAVGSAGNSGTDPTDLPIGDGKVTTSGPRKGYVYLCQASPNPGGGGASTNGPWIKSDGTFDETAKAIVDGAISWPGSVTFSDHGSALRITGNGLPKGATTGQFPIAPTDDAYQYDRNPNAIAQQSVSYTLPAHPKLAAKPTCLSGGPIGIARNGVAIFDALDAGDRDAVAHELQDACGGHPQQQGVYHYHSIPSCLLDGEPSDKPSGLVGYALDGIPIYGPRGDGGTLVSNDDLDACHGRTSWVTYQGKRVRLYHYQATLEYPYTLGCYRGTPVGAARSVTGATQR